MSRFCNVDTAVLVKLYTVSHLTLAQIAGMTGMSRQAVWLRLKSKGIQRQQGTMVQSECTFCGKPIERSRSRARGAAKSYCNAECYYASLGKDYKPWRQGCRIARAIVAQLFPLQREHVVDHRDGDERNNDRANLRVYASHSDHMAMHRGVDVKPLWDGALLGTLHQS